MADPAELGFELTPARAALLCHRHLGVGSDGVLLLTETGADGFGLRIVNPDGTDAEKSGNGIRIFAKWLWETHRARADAFVIRTPGGAVPVEVEHEGGRVRMVTADMGAPTILEEPRELTVAGEHIAVVPVSMGNPHCVVPREALDVDHLRRLGPAIEHHPAFPHRTNVQLVHVDGPARVRALVWERGAGETLASGTSACAVAAACQYRGWVGPSVVVEMPGGELAVRSDERGHLWLRGAVEEVGQVLLSPDFLARLRALA